MNRQTADRHSLPLTPPVLVSLPTHQAILFCGKFSGTKVFLPCQGKNPRDPGWSSCKCKSTIGSALQLEPALLRFIGEVNGTLNLFGFLMKFLGNCFWRLWKRTVCSVPVLHIGFIVGQKWEFGFWSCHLE